MKNYHFCLNGIGYLQDVIKKNGKISAVIRVIQDFCPTADNLPTDELYLECEATTSQQVPLQALAQLANRGYGVIVAFEVGYESLAYLHHGQAAGDPGQLIGLKGKLQQIERELV